MIGVANAALDMQSLESRDAARFMSVSDVRGRIPPDPGRPSRVGADVDDWSVLPPRGGRVGEEIVFSPLAE